MGLCKMVAERRERYKVLYSLTSITHWDFLQRVPSFSKKVKHDFGVFCPYSNLNGNLLPYRYK